MADNDTALLVGVAGIGLVAYLLISNQKQQTPPAPPTYVYSPPSPPASVSGATPNCGTGYTWDTANNVCLPIGSAAVQQQPAQTVYASPPATVGSPSTSVPPTVQLPNGGGTVQTPGGLIYFNAQTGVISGPGGKSQIPPGSTNVSLSGQEQIYLTQGPAAENALVQNQAQANAAAIAAAGCPAGTHLGTSSGIYGCVYD